MEGNWSVTLDSVDGPHTKRSFHSDVDAIAEARRLVKLGASVVIHEEELPLAGNAEVESELRDAKGNVMSDDYDRLRAHLAARRDHEFYISKSGMEEILGRSLPVSADQNQYWANVRDPAHGKPVQRAIADSGFEAFMTGGSWPLILRPRHR